MSLQVEVVTMPQGPSEVPRRGFFVTRCAYCGYPSAYTVLIWDGQEVVGSGYCCAEPTHWVWLLAGIDDLIAEGEFL